MYCDNVVRPIEDIKIHEIGIKMGFNPAAISRVLKLMNDAENHIVSPELVILAFQEQHN
jgi:hypothetical protein